MGTHELHAIDLHSIEHWHADGYPWEAWRQLRREAPVYWYERDGIDPAWMVTGHAEVKAVSSDSSSFLNSGPQLRYAAQDYNHRARAAKLRKAELHEWDPDVVDDILAFREVTGDFGELVVAGMDWVDEGLTKRSMQLMAEEVMPRVNEAIGKSKAAAE